VDIGYPPGHVELGVRAFLPIIDYKRMQNVLFRTSGDKIHLKIDKSHEFPLCMVVPKKSRLVNDVPKMDERQRSALYRIRLPASVPRVVSIRSAKA
jgi:hypothetical protein